MSRGYDRAQVEQLFKKCTYCGHPWRSREELLQDAAVGLVGYQVNFDDLELGFFLFNHTPCDSTFAVPLSLFLDLHDGPIFSERKTDTAECPEYCLHQGEFRPCAAKCECAYIRDLMLILCQWPKTG